MLKNESYTGIIKCGDTQTEIFPELQIIDPDIFAQARELLTKRSVAFQERSIPLQTKGKGLLSGNIYCGHCNARLVQTTSTKTNRLADGSIGASYIRNRYNCYNKTRHSDQCGGQTGYTVHIIDKHVDKIVRGIFERIKDSPQNTIIARKYEQQVAILKTTLASAKERLAAKQSDYESYKAEMLKVIRGESSLDHETLNELIQESKEALELATEEYNNCEKSIDNAKEVFEALRREQHKILSWAEMYDSSSHEAKKMIISKIVDRVTVRRNYEISIDLNLSYQDYMGMAESMPDEPKRGMEMSM